MVPAWYNLVKKMRAVADKKPEHAVALTKAAAGLERTRNALGKMYPLERTAAYRAAEKAYAEALK